MTRATYEAQQRETREEKFARLRAKADASLASGTIRIGGPKEFADWLRKNLR